MVLFVFTSVIRCQLSFFVSCWFHDFLNFTSMWFLSSPGPGSAALPSSMKYFGSEHDDEDADEEEEEEEEEENERKKPSASNITTSCQVSPRKTKAPSRVITNGNGIFSTSWHHGCFFIYYLFLFDYAFCGGFFCGFFVFFW